jgi:hypothetical protein
VIRGAGIVLVALLLGAALPMVASAQTEEAATHLEAVLAADVELTTVMVDPSGDATVIFAIRNVDDDPAAIRAGATADTLSVLRTAYTESPPTALSSVTVLGTFPFKSTKGKSVRASPVLRAVLSADRAEALDWTQVTPEDVPNLVDVWWLQAAFANVSNHAETSRPQLAVAMAHLEEALSALNTGDVPVGRSQFKQFFDAWDDINATVAQLYPAQYEALDAELEHAEIALLHSQPEDIDRARDALQNVREIILSMTV